MWPDLIAEVVFKFLVVFARIGGLMMLAPAIGSGTIPARARLVLGLAISFLVFALLRHQLPTMPDSPWALAVILFWEATKGIMIALVARVIAACLHVAGTIIGFQGGLAAAQQFDPNQGSSGALLAAFLSMLGVLIIFTTDLHHLLIRSMVGSYALLPVGQGLMMGDVAELGTNVVAASFAMGVQLASPFIVYAIVYNVSLGLIARMMPQHPVFFVGMPINLYVAFFILALVLPTMMMWFGSYFDTQMRTYFPPF